MAPYPADDARQARSALAEHMIDYLNLEAPETAGISRRARLVLAIASVLVLLMFVGVVEVGALAAATIVSSGRNHK